MVCRFQIIRSFVGVDNVYRSCVVENLGSTLSSVYVCILTTPTNPCEINPHISVCGCIDTSLGYTYST